MSILEDIVTLSLKYLENNNFQQVNAQNVLFVFQKFRIPKLQTGYDA